MVNPTVRSKTLEELEQDFWGEPGYDSYLVTTCHALRKKPLNQFDTEDLRIMIGQNISLVHLIPIALEQLTKDILAEGDFYPGDLLKAILSSEATFWLNHPNHSQALQHLIHTQHEVLLQEDRTLVDACREWERIFEK
ncbi:MAG: hypothetical protein H6608_11870 [Flavobacteriales bacterium]|nr:hypothetical protein [Bacteroidota bacterium]MCB9241826.1 hypothetical protein [Flavobacteriales bacterium]